jgi:hypothetical protein
LRFRHAAFALAFVAVVAGCGGTSKHTAVVDYINRINDVERGMAAPIGRVTQANQNFARNQASAGARARLVTSERTMRKLRARLVALAAPPEATRLRTVLVELVDREVDLAHEVVELATFVPSYQAALQPLAGADKTLKQELAASAKGAAATKALDLRKADALDLYARTVGAAIAAIRPLDPPRVWQPAYRSQLDALQQLRASASGLGQAIRANDATRVPQLLQRFDEAAVADQSVAAQKRQIDAVKAYDARIRAIATLAAKVQKERVRLQNKYS